MGTPIGQRHGLFLSLRAWMKRHKQVFIVTAGLVCVAVIGGQLLYPQDKALPFARLNGELVRGQERNQLTAKIQALFAESEVTLKAGDKETAVLLRTMGADVDSESMADELVSYQLWERLIPFSFAFKQPDVRQLDVYFDQVKLRAAADSAKGLLSIKPTDARLAIKDGKLAVTPAKSGVEVTSAALVQVLGGATFGLDSTTLDLPTAKVPPTYGDDDIAPVRKRAQAALSRDISLTAPDGSLFQPDDATVASWLVVITAKSGKVTLSIDEKRVAKYVASLNDKLGTDPGVTKLTLVDGEVTDRDHGSQGEEIAASELIDQLKKAVMNDDASRNLAIKMQPVASAVVSNRRYTSSQKGLQAYIDYVTSTQDVHISLVQLDGKRWKASGRANESIPSASTYKLFVSLVMFDRINSGKLHWNDKMLDTTVAGCFERMIVPSTNPCAEKFIAEFGRDYINKFAYARGFSHGTDFNGYDATHTTAADLTKYLVGLYNGTLVSGDNRAKLLEKMGRQLYRYGIPTGSAGWVQDKVGFLWDYVHDTAIVHHPRGTYVVTIMTRGQSYGRIAQIDRELERIMYP